MATSPADALWALSGRTPLTVFESICFNLFLIIAAIHILLFAYSLVKGDRFVVKGKHVYLTGGSVGLGRGVAVELAKKGAHVTIVARKKAPLEETVELMKRNASNPETQKFAYVCADLTDKAQAARALDEACAPFNGAAPDVIMTCAGMAIPKLFIDYETEEFERNMQLNYFGTLYTIHEGVKRMVRDGVKGKVVLVSSTMGMVAFAGYAAYTPTKYALTGLAETLRNELLLYGISTHIYYPGTMFTPGYETENLTKPQITRELEGKEGLTPEMAAKGMLKGLSKGYYAVTTDFDTKFLRATKKGVTPFSNVILEFWLNLISPFATAQVRWEFDTKVKNYAKKLAKETRTDTKKDN
ncbi:3-dehydrosphinganine reductase [Actinomortierella ambigua]|nr:3-dehydrosphinganine reductase [Actinomortierella ambigua]